MVVYRSSLQALFSRVHRRECVHMFEILSQAGDTLSTGENPRAISLVESRSHMTHVQISGFKTVQNKHARVFVNVIDMICER